MTGQLLEGRAAIVTGAGMGMGEATAILFAEHGARVLVSDIDAAAGEATVEAIRAAGGEALFQRCDVGDEHQAEAMVAACVEAFGRLDCAVNNAGVAPEYLPVENMDFDAYERIMRVNVRGVMACMKYEIRQMRRQGGGGAIVNTGSVSSFRPQPETSAYTASKHAVIGLTRTAAVEVSPYGIRVNAVLPGAIDTPMLRAALGELETAAVDYAPQLSLLNRFGTAREVAQAHLFLCSDLSSYVTGHPLAVEAGYLAR